MYTENDQACLGACATIPAFRNQGVQKALLRGRLREGLQRGVQAFSLETEHPEPGREADSISFTNVGKVGFTQISTRHNYRLTRAL